MICPHCHKEIDGEYSEIKFNNKLFRIYIWENKLYGNLINNLPKGFRLSEFQEFNELIESKKIKLAKERYYIVKHFNKLQWNKEHYLSRLCLSKDLDIYLYIGCLEDFNDIGRVVLVRDLK